MNECYWYRFNLFHEDEAGKNIILNLNWVTGPLEGRPKTLGVTDWLLWYLPCFVHRGEL